MTLNFLRSPFVILALIIYAIVQSGPQIAHAVDSVIDGNIVFTGPGQGGAKDIRTSNTDGGLRIFNGQTLSPIPEGAAIQFFGNSSAAYPGQAYIDSGAHNNAALIFRTAGTGQGIAERMRVTAAGNVGIGTAAPNEQLELTGNLRLPATTATTGIIRSGANTLLHTFGFNNFFAGINAGNLTMNGCCNTATGFQALTANTNGSDNTATGSSALQSNTSGGQNTATGDLALFSNTLGTSNTAVGMQALYGNTTGNNNVGLGRHAGSSNDSGTNNIFIGFQSDADEINLFNATAIGANARVGASSSMVLGGTGMSAVNVGIGTTTPISALQVVGGYLQFSATSAGAPTATDCDTDAERGRLVIDTTNNLLYVCNGATRGWDSIALTN